MPYGVIEFTHTKQPLDSILPELVKREDHALPLASKRLAYENLHSARRNYDLVNDEELHAKLDFNAYAVQLAKKNGRHTMEPVIKKELLHYEILRAMEEKDLLESLLVSQ